MVRRSLSLFATLTLISLHPLSSTSAMSQSCDGIVDPTVPDGTWLFSIDGRPYVRVGDALNRELLNGRRSRNVDFAYVIADSAGARDGIVVVKTGKTVSASEETDRVALARSSGDRCNTLPFDGNAKGSVSGQSYDRYHDYSYSDGDDARILDNFHTKYAVRGGGCKRSNDDSTDSYFGFRWQSNRSQFSFDRNVVSNGQYSQFVDQFVPTRAYASGMRSRRVEIKYYKSNAGPVCVTFQAKAEPGSFVRIVDIERRSGYRRSNEESWEWPSR